jgi:hypothetical protein
MKQPAFVEMVNRLKARIATRD